MCKRASPIPRSSVRCRAGQGLTEYILIVFLLAVGTLGIVGLFGDNLRQLFGASAQSLAGNETTQNGGTSDTSALQKWSMKGGGIKSGGNPGGTTNSMPAPGGNPTGSTND